jgi:capsular exopolysaccharide synthesis family protein
MYFLNPAKFVVKAVFKVDATEPTMIIERGERAPVAQPGEQAIFQRDQLNLIKSGPVLRGALNNEKVRNLSVVEAHKEPVSWLQDEMKATVPEGTDLMILSIAGQKPDELEVLMGGVKEAYLEQVVNAEKNNKRKDLEEMEQLTRSEEDKIRQKKDTLIQLARELRSTDSEVIRQRQTALITQYSQKSQELTNLESRLRTTQFNLESITGDLEKKTVAVPAHRIDNLVEDDARVRVQKDKLFEIEENIDKWKSRLRKPEEGGKRVADMERQAAELRQHIEALRKKVRDDVALRMRRTVEGEAETNVVQLKNQVRTLNEQISKVRPEVEQLRKEMDAIGGVSVDYQMEKSKLEGSERLLKSMQESVERKRIDLQNTKQRVTFMQIDKPALPDYKTQAIFVGVAGVLGLVVGASLVSFREYRAGKITSTAEVTQDIGLRVLGTLPPLSRRLLSSDAESRSRRQVFEQSLLIESIDGIRTLLLRDAQAAGHQVLMIASANSQEGKTMLASHLASSIARTGRRTALVDCDLRRPGVHRLFDVTPTPGMSEVLRGQNELNEIIRPTRLENLFVMPAGQCDRHAIESLARNNLPELLAKLRSEYDYIIIDTPPILPVPDALLISKHVDAVVISVRPSVSHAANVFAGCERLQAMGVPLLGTVVNGDRAHANGLEYNSYYYTRT